MKLAQEKKIFQDNPNFKDYIDILYRILKNTSHTYIMINNSNLKEFLVLIEKSKFELCQILIWEKSTKIFNPYFMLNHEYILLLRKGYKNIKLQTKSKHNAMLALAINRGFQITNRNEIISNSNTRIWMSKPL